jgi:inositol 2-dehydrogenase
MKINFGLIGAGRMGKVFAHNLAYNVTDANLVAIADPGVGIACAVAERFGVDLSYTDYHDLLARQDITAVVITTPTGTHTQVVKDAAAAGKQIFCEKPLSLTLAGCDEAISAVDKAGVMLMVGFMRRFDPPYIMAKKQIDDGVIGEPVMFKGTGRDPRCPNLEFARRKNSGGLIMDMGIHDFDLARWLMGNEVERVSSEGGCLVFPELKGVGDIDNAVINLKYKNGAIGNIDVSRNAIYGYDIRAEVIGSKGGLFIGAMQQTATLVMTEGKVTHDTVPSFMERFPEAYAGEIKEFVDCIKEDRLPAVSGKDARAATAIGVAATMSYDEGRPVLVSEAG